MGGVGDYPCVMCDKRYPEFWRLTQHMRVHTREKPFTCDICNRGFTTSSERNRHKSIHLPHHERLKSFVKCQYCKKMFVSNKILRLHIKNQMCTKVKVSRRSVWSCVFCSKIFKSSWHLNMHILGKIKERPFFNLECKLCLQQFLSPNHLQDHVHTHTGERPYLCKSCGKRFSNEQNLKTHNLIHRRVDNLPNKCVCKLCGKKYMSMNSLNGHMHREHRGVVYECKFCEKVFKARKGMYTHIQQVHIKETPHECKHCERSFVFLADLEKHENTHTRKVKYPCGLCGQEYLLESSLKQHIKTHIYLKPFSRVFCAKEFRTAGFLRKHIAVHTRERTWK